MVVMIVDEWRILNRLCSFFFFQAEDGIRDLVRSRGLGDVYKRQGLNNAETNQLYIKIMLLFVSLVMIPGFTIAYFIGKLIDRMIGSFLAMDQNYTYFQITDGLILGIILIIFLVSMLVTGLVARKILLKSPGDLIYNR